MADFDPYFSFLRPDIATSPDISQWYNSQYVTSVPDTIAPFLEAHGFLVVGYTPYEVAGDFAGFLLNMQRQAFSHASATQSLLEFMVFAYNEGRVLNNIRYEDLIANLRRQLNNHQAEIGEFIDETVTDATSGYVTLLLSNLDLLEGDHASYEADLNSLDSGERDIELSRQKTLWQNATTPLEAEYGTMTSGLNLPGLITDVDVSIGELDDALSRFTD